ncbi:hypothetical protein GCM10008018_31020 [Paenibacillus marchantiophytorum]|uniref:Uncharacterized protein n=1 Tax=Paenibacillus marchantiophytorum TaxID=1619310 RepID=A0ABQ1ER32_9BACL|nr:hypothetical protein [Paenibacillus marchantiophytorum]GFZ82888.1 hypothetical protein GCM10008018_31020 [Paenibacillus marchantiophytorum]
MKKKLITASLVLSLSASMLSIPAFGASSSNPISIMPVPSSAPVQIAPVNPFDEVKQYLPKSISPFDLVKMEALFNQIQKLQDELDGLNRQYNDLLGKYEEFPSFQEVKKDFPSILNNDELKKLEVLYNQIAKLKKEGKTSQTNPLWEQYYKILDSYSSKEPAPILEYGSIEPAPTVDYGSKEPAYIFSINSFDEEKQYLPKSISSSDLSKMEVLFNQARKLQDAIDSLDKQYNDLLGKYEEFPSFQEVKKDFPNSLDNDDLKKLEALYNQIAKLKKDGKTSQTDPLWDQYYNILYK